jgi:restriction system protein
LAELSGDYLNWLLRQEQIPWGKNTPEARAVYAVRLDKADYGEDVVHDACAHILAQKKKFAKWLESANDEAMANALLILIARVINMLNHQLEAQGEVFAKEGGFREMLTGIRVEARAQREAAPACPDCGKPMTRRQARSGKNAGKAFWGCTGYPDCRGVRELGEAKKAKESRESSESNPSS